MTRAQAEKKAQERYPHEGSGHLRAAFIEAYESGSLQGAKLAWEAALDAVEFDTFSGPRVTKSFDDWLKEITEGEK